ncbi:MAG: amidohydrolase family protein [Kiritimatiellia bacterium]
MRKKLHDYIMGLKAVDAHEHLLPEEKRLTVKPDVIWLFYQYAASDLRSAGMSAKDAKTVMDPDASLDKRWRLFRPYYEFIKNTGFAQGVRRALKDLYGCNELNDKTYGPASEKIASQNKPGITDRFLGKKGRIGLILNNNYLYKQPVSYAFPIVRLNLLWEEEFHERLMDLETQYKFKVTCLDSFLELMTIVFKDYRRHNVIGVKMVATPPAAIIGKSRAARYFMKMLRRKKMAGEECAALFFSFLQDKAIELAARSNLTIAVHCGYGTNCYDFTQARITHMIPLLQRHPEARFDLFHLGYPWIGEAIAIAKAFDNCSLNLCWSHAINLAAYERAVVEIASSVPANKILAMGGDTWRLPDVSYGFLKLARAGLARALSGCIHDGRLSFDEARDLAERWLYSNAFSVYPQLKLHATVKE